MSKPECFRKGVTGMTYVSEGENGLSHVRRSEVCRTNCHWWECKWSCM
jgi:hypothetical protein